MRAVWLATGLMTAAGIVAVPAKSEAGARLGVAIFVGHDSGYGYRDAFRIGFDRGYRDGQRHGAKDGHGDDDYNFWHDRRYRKGDAGYRPWFGSRHEYVAGYRRGYEKAYGNTYAATRHRHRGQKGYCDLRHDDDRYAAPRNRDWDGDDDGRIYEEPDRRY